MTDKKTTVPNQIWIDTDTLKSLSVASGGGGGTLSAGGAGAGPVSIAVGGTTITGTGMVQWPSVTTSTVRIEYMIFNTEHMVIESPWQIASSCSNDPSVYLPMVYRLRYEKLRNYSTMKQVVRIRVVSEQTERIMDMIQ